MEWVQAEGAGGGGGVGERGGEVEWCADCAAAHGMWKPLFRFRRLDYGNSHLVQRLTLAALHLEVPSAAQASRFTCCQIAPMPVAFRAYTRSGLPARCPKTSTASMLPLLVIRKFRGLRWFKGL